MLYDANNYRPISVISVFSRIFKRIGHDQVYEYLKANKALTMSQSAFRKLFSTITPLIDSTDCQYENIDQTQLNFAVFLDFKMAFDTVDHKILLEKLKKFLETAFNHTQKTEGSTVPPMVMSQGLGQLHLVFPKVPVLAPYFS